MAPSSIGVGGGSSRKAKAFPPALIAVVTAAVCIFLVVVGLGYYIQRKCSRDKENNKSRYMENLLRRTTILLASATDHKNWPGLYFIDISDWLVLQTI